MTASNSIKKSAVTTVWTSDTPAFFFSFLYIFITVLVEGVTFLFDVSNFLIFYGPFYRIVTENEYKTLIFAITEINLSNIQHNAWYRDVFEKLLGTPASQLFLGGLWNPNIEYKVYSFIT